MSTRASPALHTGTPTLQVFDNRGLTVRTLQYHRHPDTPSVTDERITRRSYDPRGVLTRSADPRLHAAGRINVIHYATLTGETLRTDSVDAGSTVQLSDIAGRPLLGIDAAGVTRTWQYEDESLPGRLLAALEQPAGQPVHVTGRFVYASNSAAEQALNLAGACVSCYDTAGLQQTDSIALTGVPLSVTRRLLNNADNPDTVADWQGDDASAWNNLLAREAYTTLSTTDAIGTVLTTTDAKGNLQRVAYDVAGLLSGSWLTLKGGTEQVIIRSLTYTAAGQKLHEVHGNGVITTYTYEPKTQRLTGVCTERPAGHAAGAKVLQDLRYDYDPVGNVLGVRNDAEETRFWRNQKVVPENTYVYDSLYQLASATGREMATVGQQGSNLPAATVPLPADTAAYTNYTRNYIYDEAGNLTQLRHSAPATNNNYSTNITVSDRSNRAVLSMLTENTAKVDALFDAAGSQRQLLPGQSLAWTSRSELQKVTPVSRTGSDADDSESYRYDGSGQRLLKVRVQTTGGSKHIQRVRYLAGLEQRSTTVGATETENLQVITVGEAGRAQVRVMHWESGKPAGIDNDQVRYSYDTLIGSSGLEVDGDGRLISQEEYYPYGGTAIWTVRSQVEAGYKTVRYSGKERDATGLYYYGYRYYQPWVGRWLSADPAGTIDGLNLFRMVRNNPASMFDPNGLFTISSIVENAARKTVGKLDTYLTRKTTNYLLDRGYSMKTALKWNQLRRSLMLGIGVGVGIASILSGFGVAIGVSAAVGAVGFGIGAGLGWFANKLSDRFADFMSQKMEGRSVGAQMVAGAGVAAASSVLHNASGRGTAIAGGAGGVSSGMGAVMGKTAAGMAGANAAGAAVGAADTLSGKQARLPVQVGAVTGGVIGGWVLGTPKGSADVGEWAGVGAYSGGRLGRYLDSWLSPLSWITTIIDKMPNGGRIVAWGARRVTQSSGGSLEWSGAALGGVGAGVYRAADIRTDGEMTNVSHSIGVARSTVSLERLGLAFRNYFISGNQTGSSTA